MTVPLCNVWLHRGVKIDWLLAVSALFISGWGCGSSQPELETPEKPRENSAAPLQPKPVDASDAGAQSQPQPDAAATDGVEGWQYLGSFLTDEDQAKLPRAAVIVRGGRAGITPAAMEAPYQRSNRDFTVEVPVVAETAELARVVHDSYGVRYALYLAKSDLDSERPARTVALAPEPGAKALDMPVELAGGAKIKVLERRTDWVQVEYDRYAVRARGWLQTKLLRPVFERTDFDLSDAEDDLRIEEQCEVFDKPYGQVIAQLSPVDDDDFSERVVQRLGPATDGFVEVEALAPRVRVHGYVLAGLVGDKQPQAWGGLSGGGGGWGASHTKWLKTPTGTLIFEKPDGPIFAMTIRKYSYITLPGYPIDGWAKVAFKTPWREVYGWVECPALRFVSGKSGRYECTEADDPTQIQPPVDH